MYGFTELITNKHSLAEKHLVCGGEGTFRVVNNTQYW